MTANTALRISLCALAQRCDNLKELDCREMSLTAVMQSTMSSRLAGQSALQMPTRLILTVLPAMSVWLEAVAVQKAVSS